MTIWKYPLETQLINTIIIPPNHGFLKLGYDAANELAAWFIVDETQEEREEIQIYCVGTGQKIDILFESLDSLNHLETIVEDMYVWHFLADDRAIG